MDQVWVDAVRERIEGLSTIGELRSLREPEAVADVQQLSDAMRAEGSDLEARHLLGQALLLRSYAPVDGVHDRDFDDLKAAVVILGDCFVDGAKFTPVMDEVRPFLLEHAAECAVKMLQRGDSPARTAFLWNRIVWETPEEDQDWRSRVCNAGSASRMAHKEEPQHGHLKMAVLLGRASVNGISPDTPSLPTILINFAGSLHDSYLAYGEEADLAEAIDAGTRAVAAMASGDPLRARALQLLSEDLVLRHQRRPFREDIDRAVALAVQYTDATPETDTMWAARHSRLAQLLRERFSTLGDPVDLNMAIRLHERVLGTELHNTTAPVGYLCDLVGTLAARYEYSGRSEDIERAIAVAREAVKAASGPSIRALSLANLNSALRIGFTIDGDRRMLEEAVAAGREALALTPPDHENHATRLGMLSLSLSLRFDFTANADDLDEAIDLQRRSMSFSEADFAHLNNLGLHLLSRFLHSGSLADVDEAVRLFDEAAAQCPPESPSHSLVLSNTGKSLRFRFERSREPADLERAVNCCRQAVEATPDTHSEAATHWTNLGAALLTRYTEYGEHTDIDESVAAFRQAVDMTPSGHPFLAGRLTGLAAAFHAEFWRTEQPERLDQAIDAARRAVGAMPGEGRAGAGCLNNLGLFLAQRVDLPGTAAGQQAADRDEAAHVCEAAAHTVDAPPTLRVQAAAAAAHQLRHTDAERAATLLEEAVHLLPRMVPRRNHRGDQQAALELTAGLAPAAVAAVLTAAEEADGSDAAPAERALSLLETGRAVLFSQALETRSELTALREAHPGLAARFADLRDRLDRPAHEGALPSGGGLAAYRVDPVRHTLGREFENVLTEIRALPGLSAFLLPPKAHALVDIVRAGSGPVVVLNSAPARSDALLVTVTGVEYLPLPEARFDDVIRHVLRIHKALRAAADPSLERMERIEAQKQVHDTLAWLWTAVTEPVLRRIGHTAAPADGTAWPRLWWAPGGLFGLLPLHAAGHHIGTDSTAAATVMDRVISSYTPTLRALKYARRPAANPGLQRSLLVAMPTTAGAPPLNGVAEEMKKLTVRLPSVDCLVGDGTAGRDAATTANVLERLPGCSFAHFACHGISDSVDPSLNRLLIHDYEHAPLTVASLSGVKLENAALAYLSACSTAINPVPRLLDEGIHLTSAFQLAGFRHVVGTLWEIGDALAARTADDIYAALIGDSGALDSDRTAAALHATVRTMRDQMPALASQWAAYVHAGA
ncbi:CHAT domain-containing protein [Streptomyces sp. NPDC102282]|uniref:CHAT domain-containing protein n=1 Tax=Streptomyces sp. NPDC102282 TaxID=3366154 RepID=UPI003809583D